MWLRRVYFVLSKFLRAKIMAPKRQDVFLNGALTACFHCQKRAVYHGPIILETV